VEVVVAVVEVGGGEGLFLLGNGTVTTDLDLIPSNKSSTAGAVSPCVGVDCWEEPQGQYTLPPFALAVEEAAAEERIPPIPSKAENGGDVPISKSLDVIGGAADLRGIEIPPFDVESSSSTTGALGMGGEDVVEAGVGVCAEGVVVVEMGKVSVGDDEGAGGEGGGGTKCVATCPPSTLHLGLSPPPPNVSLFESKTLSSGSCIFACEGRKCENDEGGVSKGVDSTLVALDVAELAVDVDEADVVLSCAPGPSSETDVLLDADGEVLGAA